jgi:hypothetical protein
MKEDVARATAAWAEMRRQAEGFEAPREPRSEALGALLAKPGAFPVCHGTGHAGAI